MKTEDTETAPPIAPLPTAFRFDGGEAWCFSGAWGAAPRERDEEPKEQKK